VVAAARIGDGEADRHTVEKRRGHAARREIRGDVKDEFVAAGGDLVGIEQRRIGATVGVGYGALDELRRGPGDVAVELRSGVRARAGRW